MKVEIERVTNGYILSYINDAEIEEKLIFEERETDIVDPNNLESVKVFKELVLGLQELLGVYYSKHNQYNFNARIIKTETQEEVNED